MSRYFEELDYRPTPIGALSLRRRRILALGLDVFEIMLGEEHLMSSLFTASEIELGRLGIQATEGDRLDVVVGGLGLGYTARAVLECDRVDSLTVIEMLKPVIEWHESGLLPIGTELAKDPRCTLRQGDFFELAASSEGFVAEAPGRRFDAVLVDIDHSPDALLNERSESFYTVAGLRSLARHLKPGGVFALWSDDRASDEFCRRLATVFGTVRAEAVVFENPLQHSTFQQTVYLAGAALPAEG